MDEQRHTDDDLRIYISLQSHSRGQQLVIDGPFWMWRELMQTLGRPDALLPEAPETA